MDKQFHLFGLLILILVLASCSVKPKGAVDFSIESELPDYSQEKNWAALPWRADSADLVPGGIDLPDQDNLEVDVFFLHPTSYTGNNGHNQWNADLDDEKLNLKTDKYSIKHQASIFNAAGKVYAPRYRQAHLFSYYTKNKKNYATKALEIAYGDVRSAFQFYLDHNNNGRPIIIAGHSQGAQHGARLVKEFFDGTALQDKLVVAYLVGMPIPKEVFRNIDPCEEPDQTGCFCSWRSFKSGAHPPKRFPVGDTIAVTNPLSWRTNNSHVPNTENKGAVLRKFDQPVWIGLADATIYQGLLWVNKPKFPWSFLLTTRNYHIADYNFFYVNVRENAVKRVNAYLDKNK